MLLSLAREINNMFKKLFLFALLTLSIANAVTLIEPIQAQTGDAPVDLGVIGPGQTIALKFSRDTGALAAINPDTGKNALWDKASVIKSTLPQGWGGKDSLKYETPLTVYVTVSSEAVSKEYMFSVGFEDEYEGTPNYIANFKINVDSNVFDAQLESKTATAGVNQPAIYKLKVKSTGQASDTFVITATGLPYDWQFSKTFFLPYGQEKDVYFEVIGNIQKEVPFKIKVTSISSDKITKTLDAQVITTVDLIRDAQSTTLGLPLFPSAEQHLYALIGLVANLLVR
ncbi:MAG: hypothetical protein V1931_01380 [Candidatus Micrarchaeota archaeon]